MKTTLETSVVLGSNFYISENDVASKKTRASASVKKLSELNPYVKVNYTRNEWRRCENHTRNELKRLKNTLETSGEDVKTTLETSGED